MTFKKFFRILEILFSLALIITCIYSNSIIFPHWSNWVCKTESKCNKSLISAHIKTIFPRTVANACMISRIKILLYDIKNRYQQYRNKIKDYEIYFPNSTSETNVYQIFVFLIVTTYILIILPTNIVRVYLVYHDMYNSNSSVTTMWFILMYIQNFGICSSEIHFMAHCFGLYQKFRLINDDMGTLKSEVIIKNRYPLILLQPSTTRKHSRNYVQNMIYNGILSPQRTTVNTTASSIELLRMRHQFVRDVFRDLSDLYGIQLALSLCAVFLMTLCVCYGEYFSVYSRTWYSSLFYGWILQFSFRFFATVLTTHFTTKQVGIH